MIINPTQDFRKIDTNAADLWSSIDMLVVSLAKRQIIEIVDSLGRTHKGFINRLDVESGDLNEDGLIYCYNITLHDEKEPFFVRFKKKESTQRPLKMPCLSVVCGEFSIIYSPPHGCYMWQFFKSLKGEPTWFTDKGTFENTNFCCNNGHPEFFFSKDQLINLAKRHGYELFEKRATFDKL